MHEFNKASLGLALGGGANIMLNINRHGHFKAGPLVQAFVLNAVQLFGPTRHLLAGISRLLYYLTTLCLAAVFAVARCPSVCLSVRPSVTLVYCIQTAVDIVKLLCRPVAPAFQFFDPEPLPNSKKKSFRGAQNTHRWGKIAIFD